MAEMRILVADESFVYRKIFKEASAGFDKEIIFTFAADGDEAYFHIKRAHFDMVIIDTAITGRGIFELLDEVLRGAPDTYVLVIARPSPEDKKLSGIALNNGASDFIIKPIYDSYNDNVEIIRKKLMETVLLLQKERRSKSGGDRVVGAQAGVNICDEEGNFSPELVIIAASTGGPSALESIFSNLREDFPVPILLIQHIPQHFSLTLSKNLDSKSQLTIKVAENREKITAGTVYMAPGDVHMTLDSKKKIYFDDSPPINGLKPAADVLFESVAESFQGSAILVIILTGMGSDGEKGLAMLKKKTNCVCIAQSERTCVVYGMPRAVAESGYADMVLDLDKIPGELESIVLNQSRRLDSFLASDVGCGRKR